ncbi:broad specificity phosphatase PhoE [Bacillus pakistanensis]|uniref:Broad specificity phosphatase PhoE n=1 Tax=Rossellomorea pakistanensis TaxID=992288 RepID=A0ABS2N9B5_9BACI|nr:histidine phosphatase family protein [Bacillus pakistanensis]MBM7584156.1 broad specificity phosphatase PhoE [Bacillus pakistanensis]
MKLILIKHSMPVLDSELPSNKWILSDAGKKDSREIASYLKTYDFQTVYSSDEPKAIETAEIIANELGKKAAITENTYEHKRRSNRKILPRNDFEELMRKFFEKPTEFIFGEETADMARKRFTAAVEEIIDSNETENDIILVTHGTVISLFINQFQSIDVFNLWNELECPSFVELTLPTYLINKIVKLGEN